MSVYVLSKLSMTIDYSFYEDRSSFSSNVDNIPVVKRKVRVVGGAGLPSSTSGRGEMTHMDNGQPLWTSEGVVTPIKESDYELLKDHHLFKTYIESEHYRVFNYDIANNTRAIKKETNSLSEDPFGLMNVDKMSKKVRIVKATTGLPPQEDGDQFRI